MKRHIKFDGLSNLTQILLYCRVVGTVLYPRIRYNANRRKNRNHNDDNEEFNNGKSV